MCCRSDNEMAGFTKALLWIGVSLAVMGMVFGVSECCQNRSVEYTKRYNSCLTAQEKQGKDAAICIKFWEDSP